jgi:cellulose synthase/poly-beta-1,6-N-acetylglucosamine synthase-like glycosyltransferase
MGDSLDLRFDGDRTMGETTSIRLAEDDPVGQRTEGDGEASGTIPFRPDATVRRFLRSRRDQSAVDVITNWQVVKILLVLGALATAFCYDYKRFWAGLLFAVCGFYLAVILYKLVTVFLSILRRPEIRVDEEAVAGLRDEDLPVYTILLPMYKEGAVAEKLIRAVDHFDYPHWKLDVKVLLEEDDTETVRLCRELDLPGCCDVIVTPNSFPKTKPKACNHGLASARGEYLVIYDAEDVPEPDQLKKAVAGFRQVPDEVVCLQVKLNYYNPMENWLTRWFTIEYTSWFEFFLPGLHALDAPIPLGGTSNHFRSDVLKELGGWDPFNVTEDCDLGIRLHREGFRTRVLDSTTWEEANEKLGNWIRQRSRWVKGYLQTHLVHSRSTLRTLRELGPFGFASYLLTVGGLSLTLLLNPIFWIVLLIYGGLWAGHLLGADVTPWRLVYTDRISDLPGAPYTLWSQMSWVFAAVALTLFLANFLFVILNVLACPRRGLAGLLPAALISPIYWVLISVAAWKGALQLLIRPFYWEKTQHGLTRRSASEIAEIAEHAHDSDTRDPGASI